MNPPKMPIHIGDFLRDTGHLRAAGCGAYLLLLFHHWSTGSLPDDDDQLSAIARMSPAEWRKAKPVMAKFFEPGWVHERVLDDLAESHESYEKLSKAGKLGAEAKAKKKRRLSIAASDDTSNATSIAASDVEATNNLPLTFNQGKKASEAKASAPIGAVGEVTEAEIYQFGKRLLGKSSGGVITELRKLYNNDLKSVHEILSQAQDKGNKMEWIQGVLRRTERPDTPESELFPAEIYRGVL